MTDASSRHRTLLPEGWERPRGFSLGVVSTGKMVHLAGVTGRSADGTYPEVMSVQCGAAFRKVAALLVEAGGTPKDIVRLNWYITDMDAYRAQGREIRAALVEALGPIFPPMTLLQVVALESPAATVEIEVTAVIEP